MRASQNFCKTKYGGQQRTNTVRWVGLGWTYYLLCPSTIYEIILIILQLRQPSDDYYFISGNQTPEAI